MPSNALAGGTVLACCLPNAVARRKICVRRWNMRYTALHVTLFCSCLLTACQTQKNGPADAAAQRPSTPAVVPPPAAVAPPLLLRVPPHEMRAAYASAYRLLPDRRFLRGVAEVHHLLSGEKKEDAVAEFREGTWRISYKGHEAGSLPELPDFSHATEFLTAWTRTLSRQHPELPNTGKPADTSEVAGELKRSLGPDLFSTLAWADRQWAERRRDPVVLRTTTRALTLLALQSLDRLEIADVVPARALAALAVTKALTRENVAREECLLARTMGYSAHAGKICRLLPDTEPARLYVARNDERLSLLARRTGASAESRYLALLSAADSGDAEAWAERQTEFFRDQPALPLLKSALAAKRFELTAQLSLDVPAAVLRELSPGAVKSELFARLLQGVVPITITRQANLAAQAEHLERALQKSGAELRGPWLDRELWGAYYRGFFYSGIVVHGLHLLDSLSSVPDAERFAATLATSTTGISADLQRWYRHLVAAKRGGSDFRPLAEDLAILSTLGANLLARSLYEVRQLAPYVDPVPAAIQSWALRADTRLEHRVTLAALSRTPLWDLRLAEKLGRSIVETAPALHPTEAAHYAIFVEDPQLLLRLLRLPGLQDQVLKSLASASAETPMAHAVAGEYVRLMKQYPNAWGIRDRYLEYLERRKDYPAARQVALDWLSTHGPENGFDYIFANVAVARLYYKQGLYKEGLPYGEKVVDSQQGSAMAWTAALLNKLGRTAEAERMFRAVVERYPDSVEGISYLAEFLWNHDRHGDAASLLRSSPHALRGSSWSFVVAKKFAEVFAARYKSKALAAFSALQSAGVGVEGLQQLGLRASETGNHELAFEMHSRLKGFGLLQMLLPIEAYRFLRKWRGKAPAWEWLQERIPPEQRPGAIRFAYDAGEMELIWDLDPVPAEGPEGEYSWRMRAAAATQLHLRDSRREEIRRYFVEHAESAPAIGRYLMGLAGEREFLAQATDPAKRCTVAYYLALRAEAEGRYEDASDWYRLAMEIGRLGGQQIGGDEYRWASFRLYRWFEAGKSLSRLARSARPALTK